MYRIIGARVEGRNPHFLQRLWPPRGQEAPPHRQQLSLALALNHRVDIGGRANVVARLRIAGRRVQRQPVQSLRRTLNTALPATVLGGYPESHGWLHTVDVVFGLALVAYSEEIVFRRCARHVLQIYLNDGYVLVVITSILFGAYHWWTGIGNIVEAVLIGVLLMLFYRRSAALWPVVLAHYLTDIVDFGL
jgi:hypothetical protein